MRRWALLATILLVLAGCGKNDAFRTLDPYGYNAPIMPPIQPPYQGPIGGGGGYPPWVGNQIPQGMPPQFQPFVPVYNYFQQTPQLQVYWQQLWQQWQYVAYMNQISAYQFQYFWNFCGQQWQPQAQYNQLYNWLNINIYSSGGYCDYYCGGYY